MFALFHVPPVSLRQTLAPTRGYRSAWAAAGEFAQAAATNLSPRAVQALCHGKPVAPAVEELELVVIKLSHLLHLLALPGGEVARVGVRVVIEGYAAGGAFGQV